MTNVTQAAGGESLAMAADIAIVVVAAAVVILALVMAWVLLRVNRTLKEVRSGVHQNLGPVSDRARSISDNVEFITQALRTDVERLNASVKALSDRLQQASDRMEERIEDFNALMEVVQAEAEDIFLDTAATVRGVRHGATSIVAPGESLPTTSEVSDSEGDAADTHGAEPEPDPADRAQATTEET
jgi:uncharacterized protein YoxC